MKNDVNWKLLMQFLPQGWEQKAKELGAVSRQRKILSPEILLRLLLIHLADGCSMRETVVRAKQANLADISDVAFLKRLKSSSEWMRWLSRNLVKSLQINNEKPDWLSQFNVRLVDASVITEPGSTGSDWRLHYSIELFGLNCDHFLITDPKVGESLCNFEINNGDLLIGDRGYGSIKGINHVIDNGGNFLVRIRNKAFKLFKSESDEFNLLENFRKLNYGEIGDYDLQYHYSSNKLAHVRLCVIKKSPEAALYSKQNAIREMKRKQRVITDETVELYDYFFVITSVGKNILSSEEILSLYRLRWQIELAFKRLKSILALGHLPKTDPESAKAWLHGKMVVALLTSLIVEKGRSFFPWGYPLLQNAN
ncbi:MAG: IS4-like element IS421 family transposase [Ignavibacterium sp.]